MTTTDPGIITDSASAELLWAGRCHLGEGPGYDAGTDTAWWFDILGRALYEARLGDGGVTLHRLPLMASALAPVDEERQLLAAEDGLYLRDRADGRLRRLLPLEADDARTRSNDARAHPSGTFWTSTMGRRAEPGAGSLYAFRDGSVTRLFGGLTIPNAICFSPDGATGYFADTAAGTLHRVRLDPATGLPLGEPQVLRRHDGPGGLDGAVTDDEGRIWCALWGGACIQVFSPEGEPLRRLPVPARQPSCPVFVGAGFDRLLVTTAWQDMDEAARAADPGHGQTFLLDPGRALPGARGRAEPRVRLGGAT